MRACFDLLTSIRQGNKSVDEWYNVVQAQVNLSKYPPETAKILHRDIIWFFMHDEEFLSKTINEGDVDLDKFPASKARQLAKRIESPMATACHIKQVAGDPQAAQINLLRYQHTKLPAGKYKKKKSSVKSRQSNYRNPGNENPQVSCQHKKWFGAKNAHQNKERCSKCGDSIHVEGFQCPSKKFQCKACHKFGHFTSLCYQKNKLHSSQLSQSCINYKQGLYMQKKVSYAVNLKNTVQVGITFACRSKCSAHKLISEDSQASPLDNKPGFYIEVTSYKKHVSQSKNGHLYRCQHYACQCV